MANNNIGSSKNMLIGALIVIVLGLGFFAYQKSQEPEGFKIEVSEDGLSIEEN